jgi:energy-coupling factor transporter ATP-binding protein EcfA2
MVCMPEEPGVSQQATGSHIAQATDGGHATVNVYASPPALEHQNRTRFLARLRTRYRDLLDQSLQGAVRMTLELAGHPEAVAPPVQLLYETDQQPRRSLPAGTPLLQVYEQAGHELLLLGEPGSGKSTLLLELAVALVELAERDQSQLLPVIVPLSSWANKQQPLVQWLAEQIAQLYDIALPLVEHWIQQERFLPLLDGLDEMKEEARTACISTINAYHRTHLHPLVVASRSAEYEAAATNRRLSLNRAVAVQPLSPRQVDAYLERCGEKVSALRTLLQKHVDLQEIATTPLMLSIFILTYQGQTIQDLPITGSLSGPTAADLCCLCEASAGPQETVPLLFAEAVRLLADLFSSTNACPEPNDLLPGASAT